jgi:hypothetical protein
MAAEDPPWGQKDWSAKITLPGSRGSLLIVLANAAMICGILSWCLLLPAIPALILGIIVVAVANAELAKMEQQEFDPEGKSELEWARRRALWGIGLSLSCWICFAPLFCALEYLRSLL